MLASIGLSSYSLYLLHDPLISLKNFLSHKYLATPLQPFGVFIGILIIPLIAWFSYVYIEKEFMNRKPAPVIHG
jgi:peptidoglycan/LPS O-acetylase OafA/YrhL